MLSKIKIRNFKSIEDLELELAPLTIFVGPNSSGKSNVLESIAILAQTAKLERSITRSLEGSLGYGAFIRYPISDVEYHNVGYRYAFMPKGEDVEKEAHQAVFANEKKLVEVVYLKSPTGTVFLYFSYPEEFEKSLRPTGNPEYILDPTCFGYDLKQDIRDQKRQQFSYRL